nr:glycosyltransferase family 4 protein [uncultured Desulfobulbus sp.]
MKILAYSHNVPPTVGGIATYCHTLCAALTDSGEELSLLAPNTGSRWDGNYPLHSMPAGLASDQISLVGYIEALRLLRATLRRLQPDVLWCCNVDALYVIALASVDAAVTVTVHGSEIVRTFGRLELLPMIRARLLGRALARADRIIAVSRYTRSILQRHLPQVTAKIDVVHNGVAAVSGDTGLSPRAGGGGRTLLSVGRCVEFKGFHLFPEVLAGLVRLVPDIRWIIAGDGAFREIIAREVAKCGLQDRVTLLGMVGAVSLRDLYQTSDLLIHPAVTDGQGRDESFGLVLVEAMLHGCPVATTGAGGTGEIIEDGATGVLFDIRRPAEAAEKLAACLRDLWLLPELGRRGREHALRHFTHGQCAAKTLESFGRAQTRYAATLG